MRNEKPPHVYMYIYIISHQAQGWPEVGGRRPHPREENALSIDLPDDHGRLGLGMREVQHTEGPGPHPFKGPFGPHPFKGPFGPHPFKAPFGPRDVAKLSGDPPMTFSLANLQMRNCHIYFLFFIVFMFTFLCS